MTGNIYLSAATIEESGWTTGEIIGTGT